MKRVRASNDRVAVAVAAATAVEAAAVVAAVATAVAAAVAVVATAVAADTATNAGVKAQRSSELWTYRLAEKVYFSACTNSLTTTESTIRFPRPSLTIFTASERRLA